MGEPVMRYGADILRAGAGEQAGVSSAGAEVQQTLSGHGVELAMLGSVPAAAGFHVSLAHVTRRQAADAGTESTRRAELGQRATRTADLGARLTSDTTAIAGAVAGPSSDAVAAAGS
jgi:hypothetical protein